MTDARLAAAVEAAAPHRESHDPETGEATCSCGEWRGPFTIFAMPRSFAAHIATVILAAADAWDREHCGCGHGWEYHGPDVPGCCECKCRNIRRATAVRIVEDDDFAWDEPREPRPVPR